MLLVSPPFQRVKTNEPLLLLIKRRRGDENLGFPICLNSCILYFLFYFIFPTKEIFFSFSPSGNIFFRTVNKNVGAGITL